MQGDSCPSFESMGETGAQPDNGGDLQSAGPPAGVALSGQEHRSGTEGPCTARSGSACLGSHSGSLTHL